MKYIATFSSNIQKNMGMGIDIRFGSIKEFNVNKYRLMIAPLIQNAGFPFLFLKMPAIKINFRKINN